MGGRMTRRQLCRGVSGTVLAAIVLAGAAVTSAHPAAAATQPVRITKVVYDSPGTDNRSNTSLNGEYVRITNTSTQTRVLTGWTLRDATHVYTFGTFSLGPGKSVVVRTGKGTNSATTRYWRSGTYIWNNTGDKATLKNAAGTTVSMCTWTSLGAGSKTC
jgi:hypothetical protein